MDDRASSVASAPGNWTQVTQSPPGRASGPELTAYTDNLYSATMSTMSERLTTSARPLPQPDADLGYLFRLAHQRFRALLDSELEDLGLSAQEYGILSVFGTRPELSTSELARISQVTRQTMHTSDPQPGGGGAG